MVRQAHHPELGRRAKSNDLNSNFQIKPLRILKLNILNSQKCLGHSVLEFEIYLRFGAWNLGF